MIGSTVVALMSLVAVHAWVIRAVHSYLVDPAIVRIVSRYASPSTSALAASASGSWRSRIQS